MQAGESLHSTPIVLQLARPRPGRNCKEDPMPKHHCVANCVTYAAARATEAWQQEGNKGRRSYSVMDTAQLNSHCLWPQWSDMQHSLRTQHPRQSIYLKPEVAFHIRKHLRPPPPTSGRDIKERPGPSSLLPRARHLLRLGWNPPMKMALLLHADCRF